MPAHRLALPGVPVEVQAVAEGEPDQVAQRPALTRATLPIDDPADPAVVDQEIPEPVVAVNHRAFHPMAPELAVRGGQSHLSGLELWIARPPVAHSVGDLGCPGDPAAFAGCRRLELPEPSPGQFEVGRDRPSPGGVHPTVIRHTHRRSPHDRRRHRRQSVTVERLDVLRNSLSEGTEIDLEQREQHPDLPGDRTGCSRGDRNLDRHRAVRAVRVGARRRLHDERPFRIRVTRGGDQNAPAPRREEQLMDRPEPRLDVRTLAHRRLPMTIRPGTAAPVRRQGSTRARPSTADAGTAVNASPGGTVATALQKYRMASAVSSITTIGFSTDGSTTNSRSTTTPSSRAAFRSRRRLNSRWSLSTTGRPTGSGATSTGPLLRSISTAPGGHNSNHGAPGRVSRPTDSVLVTTPPALWTREPSTPGRELGQDRPRQTSGRQRPARRRPADQPWPGHRAGRRSRRPAVPAALAEPVRRSPQGRRGPARS